MAVHFFYLDASALAKRYSPEVGAALIDDLFRRVTPDRLYVFNVGVAEVVSLLVRKHNSGLLVPAAFTLALANVRAELMQSTGLNRVVADDGLVAGALPLIEAHSINATDAIILRSALDLAMAHRAAGEDLVLVASDQRLLRAARAEGLETFDPATQSQTDLDALLGP